jgi:SAM-dependent methyltransferase
MESQLHDNLLRQQIDYYRARAHEYDEWFFRRGRYDRGPELNQRWFDQIEEVQRALDEFRPAGRVLELACGTGLWTQRLLDHAHCITAVDAAPEMLALNHQRVQSSRVRYVHADLFRWRPVEQYNVVFFSFWLSHVPPRRFKKFWELVRLSLEPDGRVFFLDSLHEPTSTAVDHDVPDPRDIIVSRRLNDGRTFQICKVFYQPDELSTMLDHIGWQTQVRRTTDYFLYGQAAPRNVDKPVTAER